MSIFCRKLVTLLTLACLVPVLSACTALDVVQKVVEVVLEPDTPVGEPEEQPTLVALHTYADASMNPNWDRQPAPVTVKVFALSSDHRLYGFDFFSIVDEPEQTLGVTLTGILDESLLEPDSYVILGPYELPPRTRRIGVVAEYSDIATTTWRTSIDVDSIGDDERLLMLLLEEEVRLISEGR